MREPLYNLRSAWAHLWLEFITRIYDSKSKNFISKSQLGHILNSKNMGASATGYNILLEAIIYYNSLKKCIKLIKSFNTPNPIFICPFDIRHWIISFSLPRIYYWKIFSTVQDLLMKDKAFCLRLKGSSPPFWEKPTLVLHQYFFMAIQVFRLNLAPTYSIYLLTTYYYPRKSLSLISLQRLDSYLRSSKF